MDKHTLSADNGSFLQKNLDYQREKPTLSNYCEFCKTHDNQIQLFFVPDLKSTA